MLDDSRTLILGMSDNWENQDYWRGIVHYDGFYDKNRINDWRIGGAAWQALRNFRSGGLWREKMLKLRDSAYND